MKPSILPVILLGCCLVSCSTMKRGYDSVARGTGAAWGAVANASSAVVSSTASLGKKTTKLVTGKIKAEPTIAEVTLSLDGRQGVIAIALDDQAAPQHAENFRKLVKENYYDGLGVHRAVPNHLIQMGDPRSKHESARAVWGLGGPGYTIPAEIGLPHRRGSVGMARLGDRLNPTRQSNGSQFYICLKPSPDLDGEYSVFGRVIGGLEFADAIAKTPADDNDAPLNKVTIVGVRMVEGVSPAATAQPAPQAAPMPAAPNAAAPAPAAAKPAKKAKKSAEYVPAAPSAPAAPPAKRKGWFGRTLDRIW